MKRNLERRAERKDVRGTVSPQVHDGILLNLRRGHTYLVPIAGNLDIVDIPPLDLIRAKCRPPDVLRGTCKEQGDPLGNDGSTSWRVIRDRRDERQKVLVGESGRSRQIQQARKRRHFEYVSQGLSDIHDLQDMSQ